MVTAAPDPLAAVAVVEQGELAIGQDDRCMLCDALFEIPATIACADAGLADEAERHLRLAEECAAHWPGSAWTASLAEARAHLAAARGDHAGSEALLGEAARLFTEAGQPLDAARCARVAVG
jgi:hypothetical protein